MKKTMTVQFSDGSVWYFPSEIVAQNRAAYYAHEYGGDIEQSLKEDTLPLFEDEYEIRDWAENNMDWVEIAPHATAINPVNCNKNAEWANARKGFA